MMQQVRLVWFRLVLAQPCIKFAWGCRRSELVKVAQDMMQQVRPCSELASAQLYVHYVLGCRWGATPLSWQSLCLVV
jgi:hypothetical protein